MPLISRAWADRIPAPAIFIASGACQYTGSAIGVAVLMPVIPGFAAAWWRVAVGALLLSGWRKPWRLRLTRHDALASVAFGVALATMNMTFYEAINRIPMGAAVSIEFVGPVALALILGGGWRVRAGALATAAGVFSIGGFGLTMTNPQHAWGFVWALAAGAAWVGYIFLGTTIAKARSGLDSLALGLAAAALLTAPAAAPYIAQVISSPRLLAAAAALGIMSCALPFALEQVTLRRLGADLFSLMAALYPATSVLIGALTLGQIPSAGEAVGVMLITAGIVLVRYNKRRSSVT